MRSSDRTILRLLSFTFLVLSAATLPAQAARDLDAVDRFLRQHLEAIPTPGFSAVIVERDRVVFAKGYGVERIGGREPLTADSSIAIGSLTKSFTALAVMQLVDQGLVVLDETVVTYLPWFRTADRRGAEITVRMLLSNTGGIPSRDRWLFSRDRDEASIEKGVRSLSSVPLVRAPGKSFEYANENWSILGLIVSELSGKAYSSYLQDHVFEPMGMSRSTTALDRFEPLGVLYGHFATPDGTSPAAPRFLAEALPAGSELRASARDLGRYLITLLNGGVYRGTRVLERASVDSLFEPAITFTAHMPEMGVVGEEAAYAMGWAIAEIDGRTIAHHGGDAIVMGSWAALDRDRGIAAALLYNGPMLDHYRFAGRLWAVNNLLHLIEGQPISDFGRPKETDPTSNDYELPPELLARYAGTYLSADGLRAEVSLDEATEDRLLLRMVAGDLTFAYELDFVSESSAVLRNVGGASITSFLMTPAGTVTGLRGGLAGGVFRKRSSHELAKLQQVRSPAGTVSFSLPQGWELSWSGESFVASDPESPGTSLSGGPISGGWTDIDTAARAGTAQRSETVGGYLWQELIWTEGSGTDRRQGLRALTEAAATQFELQLETSYGELTAKIRDVLFPLMSDFQLRPPR